MLLDSFRAYFGMYSPVTTVVSGSAIDGTAVYATSTDWSYVGMVALVIIVMWSICTIIGLCFKAVSSRSRRR